MVLCDEEDEDEGMRCTGACVEVNVVCNWRG